MAGINWLDGEANFGIERISPGRHVLQTEWEPGWNDVFHIKNDYISNYECILPHPVKLDGLVQHDQDQWAHLQAAKRLGYGIPIKNMAHFTTPKAAQEIVDSGGFKGGLKKINENEKGDSLRGCLSWWSPKFEDDTAQIMEQHFQGVLEPFFQDGDNIHNITVQFASSDAFSPDPGRYGNEYFQYSFVEVCNFYNAFIKDNLQFRILGTFLYKLEIMHAVLVCGAQNGSNLFANYPEIPVQGNVAGNADHGNVTGSVVVRGVNGNWKWYPQATGTEIVRLCRYRQRSHNYRRWEHVAFALHIPEGSIMPVKNLVEQRYELPFCV